MPESPTKGDPNSTASTTGSSMILMHSSGPSASKPLHDNTAKREQNLHYGYPQGYSVCLLFLKLFERVYAPLTAGLLSPVPADNRLHSQRQSQLDRLYKRL